MLLSIYINTTAFPRQRAGLFCTTLMVQVPPDPQELCPSLHQFQTWNVWVGKGPAAATYRAEQAKTSESKRTLTNESQGSGRGKWINFSPSSLTLKKEWSQTHHLYKSFLGDPPQDWEPVMFSCGVVASSIITNLYWFSFLLCSFSLYVAGITLSNKTIVCKLCLRLCFLENLGKT